MNWRLHVLGASSTLTPPGDSNASLALSNGERIILIDAGGDLLTGLDRADLDPTRISDVIITHSHPDHTYGLPFLSHSFYHDRGEVTCWSTEEAIPRLKKSLEAYDLQKPVRYLTFKFRTVSLSAIEPIDLAISLNVSSFPTNHSRESFGLVMESSVQTIVFSGDTQPCEATHRVGTEADVLIHDCQGLQGYKHFFEGSHTSARELSKLADELNVDVLVPFHHNLVELPGGWEEIGTELRESYGGKIVYPQEGMGFIL